MARPTNPAALAALRARQAAASRAYRARQRAARTESTPYARRHGGGVVDAARTFAERLRQARTDTLKQLPDVRNLKAKIRPKMATDRAPGPARKTKAGQERRAREIRDRANAERIAGIGRARKESLRRELIDGPISEQLQEMNAHDRDRFQDAIDRITAGSNQAVGILFEHVGGGGLYTGAIDKILYPPSRQEGFDMLETLAEYAETAHREYAPVKIGTLRV